MKVLVLGGEGMLGHKMFQTLLSSFPDTACTIRGSLIEPFYKAVDVFRLGRVIDGFNAMDLARTEEVLSGLAPEVIVNCIGIVKQRDEARAPVPSITLNSLLPHVLAELASKWEGRLVHVSTDCVFSGRKGSYTEDDPTDADDLYGKTKALGEVRSGNALTLRTSIIGRELSQFQSLLEWFLSQRGRKVQGYRKVVYSGVTTNYLAEVVARLIRERADLNGLYQVASAPISKFDLLRLLQRKFDVNADIVPNDEEISDRSMIGRKFVDATGYACPPWEDLVSQLADDATPYARWRTAV